MVFQDSFDLGYISGVYEHPQIIFTIYIIYILFHEKLGGVDFQEETD